MESQKNNFDTRSYKTKNHFVYKWTNIETKEYYIGKHSGSIDDGYIGSGKLFLLKYKQNPDNWVRDILHYAPSSKAALHAETAYIGQLYKTDCKCLNLAPGGNNDRKLNTHNADLLIKQKEEQRCTFSDWFETETVANYVFIGNNLNGLHKVIDTTPKEVKEFIKFAKKYTQSFPYKFFNKGLVVKNDGNISNVNVVDHFIISAEEYELFKKFIEYIKTMIEEYNDGKEKRK
jgi:hypothetical protein